MISISNLEFSRPQGEFTLNIPSLEVDAQSAVAVTGASGSGKTTLLSLIAGILTPQSGRVKVGDTEVSQLPDTARRAYRLKQIGLIFQSFELIDYLSVLDNVLLPARISRVLALTTQLKDRARGLLHLAGMERYARRSVTRLSQGERQRVAICRALLTDPPLLLADEPTGNLDPNTSQRILQILLNQVRSHGATLLMVSHDHSLLDEFDTTVDFCSFQSNQSAGASGAGGTGAA